MQFERLSGTITRDRCTNGMKLFVLLGEIYSLDGSPAWAMFWRAATFFRLFLKRRMKNMSPPLIRTIRTIKRSPALVMLARHTLFWLRLGQAVVRWICWHRCWSIRQISMNLTQGFLFLGVILISAPLSSNMPHLMVGIWTTTMRLPTVCFKAYAAFSAAASRILTWRRLSLCSRATSPNRAAHSWPHLTLPSTAGWRWDITGRGVFCWNRRNRTMTAATTMKMLLLSASVQQMW